jgi:hypothetical protein
MALKVLRTSEGKILGKERIAACKEEDMVEGMAAGILVRSEVRIEAGMAVDMQVCMLEGSKQAGMAVGILVCMLEDSKRVCMEEGMAGMAHHKQVCKAEGTFVCMEEGMVGMAHRKQVCKALGKACMVVDNRRAGKARKWEHMARNSHYCSGLNRNSLSKEVPKHLKKSTRLTSLVVFSLNDSLLKSWLKKDCIIHLN